MNERNSIPILFVASNVLVIAGALMKIIHWSGSDSLILIGLACLLAFLILTFKEISYTKEIKENDKLLWYVGLISFTTVVGLLYILTKRNNISNQNKLTLN